MTLPMLAQSIELAELPRYAADGRFVAQLKADGQRVLITCTDGKIEITGRNGQPKVSNVRHPALAEFKAFDTGHWVLDGELPPSRSPDERRRPPAAKNGPPVRGPSVCRTPDPGLSASA